MVLYTLYEHENEKLTKMIIFQSLIDATMDPSKGTGAEIVIVISNKPRVQGLTRAENANIPTKVYVMYGLSHIHVSTNSVEQSPF
jgi:folate-dependent phosphoribosylglycinamide formyltransferase PurN